MTTVIHEGERTPRRFKDDVNEVRNGNGNVWYRREELQRRSPRRPYDGACRDYRRSNVTSVFTPSFLGRTRWLRFAHPGHIVIYAPGIYELAACCNQNPRR